MQDFRMGIVQSQGLVICHVPSGVLLSSAGMGDPHDCWRCLHFRSGEDAIWSAVVRMWWSCHDLSYLKLSRPEQVEYDLKHGGRYRIIEVAGIAPPEIVPMQHDSRGEIMWHGKSYYAGPGLPTNGGTKRVPWNAWLVDVFLAMVFIYNDSAAAREGRVAAANVIDFSPPELDQALHKKSV